MIGDGKSAVPSKQQFVEYVAKCFVGATVGYLCYKAFPEESQELLWMLLSILLSITHDNNSAVAFDRMKGNLIGSVIGLVSYFIHYPPNLLTICVGVGLTISMCFYLRLVGVSRTALAAFIIVVLYEEQHSSWIGAAYRAVSVIGGCVIGLVINYIFAVGARAYDRLTDGSGQDSPKESGPSGGDE